MTFETDSKVIAWHANPTYRMVDISTSKADRAQVLTAAGPIESIRHLLVRVAQGRKAGNPCQNARENANLLLNQSGCFPRSSSCLQLVSILQVARKSMKFMPT